MKIRCDISGLDRMQKRLVSACDKSKIQQVVAANTQELTMNAKIKAPISTEKTNPGGAHGQLKRSILPEITDGGMTGTVKATVHYAPYVELGTRFMKAQPYMRPAFEEQAPKFIKDLKQMLMKELS